MRVQSLVRDLRFNVSWGHMLQWTMTPLRPNTAIDKLKKKFFFNGLIWVGNWRKINGECLAQLPSFFLLGLELFQGGGLFPQCGKGCPGPAVLWFLEKVPLPGVHQTSLPERAIYSKLFFTNHQVSLNFPSTLFLALLIPWFIQKLDGKEGLHW